MTSRNRRPPSVLLSALLPLALAAGVAGAARAETLPITSVFQSAHTVGLYEPLLIRFDLEGEYSNPFDPRLIDARFEFTGPSGQLRFIPAFWRGGSPEWEARIVPLEIGPHTCRIVAVDGQGRTGAADLSFVATPSPRKGFIRRDARNPYYLRFDNGEPYFPIGYNMCWNHDNPLYSTWMREGARNGVNWSRIWLSSFVGTDIEWGGDLEPEYRGLGTYSPAESIRFDTTLSRAHEFGIYYQFCMDSYNGWNKNVWPNWAASPYNAANGGPLDRPIQYLTNTEAKRLAKQRFRYIVARWAYEPSILCWEFFNEIDAMGSGDDWSQTYHTNRSAGAAWHREMAQYIAGIDPFGHLFSTSFAHASETWTEVWNLPEIDIVSLHRYAGDIPNSHYSLAVYARRFNKPVFFGEANASGDGMGKAAGVDRPDAPALTDPHGETLHRQIWALAVGESGAMSWWWDSWIHPRNLYHRFRPLALFLQGEDWAPFLLSPTNPSILSGHPRGSTHLFGSAGERGGMVFVYDSSGNDTTRNLSLRIPGVTAPQVRIEFWNAGAGTVVSTRTESPGPGGLVLNFPDFNWDMAVKFKAVEAESHWIVR